MGSVGARSPRISGFAKVTWRWRRRSGWLTGIDIFSPMIMVKARRDQAAKMPMASFRTRTWIPSSMRPEAYRMLWYQKYWWDIV